MSDWIFQQQHTDLLIESVLKFLTDKSKEKLCTCAFICLQNCFNVILHAFYWSMFSIIMC